MFSAFAPEGRQVGRGRYREVSATSEDMSVLAEVRWPFVVDWKKARGRIWVCGVDGSGCIGGCRMIDRLALLT
jgi:hypothetical protein